MKVLLIFALSFICIISNAQDTIYKRNGEAVTAKVIEVNIKDISYKRADLLDGPLFIINKTDIKKIRYASGNIDSFALAKPHVSQQVVLVQQQPQYVVPNKSNRIEPSYKRGTYEYRGQRFSDNNVLFLAMQKNQVWKSKALEVAIHDCRRNKLMQYNIGWGGLIFGGVTLAATSIIADSDFDASVGVAAITGALAGGILVSSQIVSFQYKLKRHKKADEVVDLYNSLAEK